MTARALTSRRVTWLAALCLTVATPAAAQWFAAAYLGTNYTHPAEVSVVQPDRGTSLTFRDVEFEARPFESPQYYGWRVGRLLGGSGRYGVEVELIHLKVIGRTEGAYGVSGTSNGTPVTGNPRMDTLVQRYSMTHGLNYLLLNGLVRHTPRQGPMTLVGRLGAGPTLPHAETTVGGSPREQYEFGGPGVHLSAGADIWIAGRLSVLAEYKLTGSRPTVSIAEGEGRAWAVTHQVAVGLTYGLSR
jgi:hypothetical protein